MAINKDNSIFYVHNDHLNTPRKVTNTNNAVVFDWPAVDPFGANQPTINTIGFNIRYPGQYYESETAYHYNYHRYYNPKTGKYLQSDPIGLDGGYNLYNYVDNNSLSGIDPEGLETYLLHIKDRIGKFDHISLVINDTAYNFMPSNNGVWSKPIDTHLSFKGAQGIDTRYLDLERRYLKLLLSEEQEQQIIEYHNILTKDTNYKYSILDTFVINLDNAAQCTTHTRDLLRHVGLKVNGFRPIHLYESGKKYSDKEIELQPWKSF